MTNVSRCCHRIVAFVVLLAALSIAAPTHTIHAQDPTATDVPTSTPTDTATATATWTPIPTPTNTPTATDAPTAADTPTDAPTLTDTPTGAPSPTETATLAEMTPEVTETVIPSETETATPTATETANVTSTATPTLPPEPPLELGYFDSFEDGNFGTWILGAGWTYAANETGTGLQALNTADMAYFILYPLLDVVVEAQVRLDTGALRMHLRLEDSGTAYEVWLDANGQVALLRNGQVMAVGTAPQPIPGAWHNLRGSVIGDTIRVAIDGVEIIALQDPDPLPAGAVAFSGIGTGTIQLDDFRLWRPVEEVAQQSALESGPMLSMESNYIVADAEELIDALVEVNAKNALGACYDRTRKTITLTSSVYTLTEVHNSSTAGPNGLPMIICNVTIETENGSENNRATIERSNIGGTPLFRLFEVGVGGWLTLDYVVIRNGDVSEVGGGGILNRGGRLTILNSEITNNGSNETIGGGGVMIAGWVGRSFLIQKSKFFDNQTVGFGGGVNVAMNTVDDGGAIRDSHFINNSADHGGGIASLYGGNTAVSITNTVVEDNSAGNGGGVFIMGNASLQNVTIARNQVGGHGGGIYNHALSNGVNDLQISNSIIDRNTAGTTGGGVFILEFNGSNTVIISNSCFTNNTDTGVQKYVTSVDNIDMDVSNNWWGAADGPSGLWTGSGDSVGGPNVTYQPFLTAPPPVEEMPGPCGYKANFTNLDFYGKDVALQGVMFWVIFIETSSDSVISGSPADSDVTPSFADFLFTSPYCVTGANLPSNNAAPVPEPFLLGTPPDPTDPNPTGISTYIRHCPQDHRSMYAQTMMNGFLNHERRGEAPFTYVTTNNSEAIKRENTLWNISPCQTNEAGADYRDAIDRNNQAMWLYFYMQCVGTNPNVNLGEFNAARARRAYEYTILPQIQIAIADFYLNATVDPTNGAFSNLDANFNGHTIFSCVGTCYKLIPNPDNPEGDPIAGDQITVYTTTDIPLGSVWFQGTNVTQQDILDAYNRHIQNPHNIDLVTYTPFASSVLQPVLRLSLDPRNGNLLGYRWSTRTYQRVVPGEGNPIHIPRYTD